MHLVKIGSHVHDYPGNTIVYFQCQAPFAINYVDDDGKKVPLKSGQPGQLVDVRTKESCKLELVTDKFMHSTVEIRDPAEKVSDIPVEVDVDLSPKSMDQQIKDFCRVLVQHEFGSDSDQMDTFDEMFDFDEEDDGQAPLSGLEVSEMTEEFLNVSEASSNGESESASGEAQGTTGGDPEPTAGNQGGEGTPAA